MTKLKRKLHKRLRNPVARELRENPAFRIKVHNIKKEPPKPPSVKEALIEIEEEEEYENDV